jgi:hypothetical protein
MSKRSRGDYLADLADLVRELTEPRTHEEMREEVLQKVGKKRTWVREKHITTHPSLLQSLMNALTPGVTGDSLGGAGFESRPAADLEPLRVWTLIRDQTAFWCARLHIERKTLTGALAGLVSANHDDQQLEQIVRDVEAWVRQAKQATGWEAAPFTLGDRCPDCRRRNCLTVSGDLTYVRCSSCERDWPTEMIGLLGQMLEQNRTQETVGVRCASMTESDACYLVASHKGEHRGPTGRYWLDVSAAS